MVRNSSKAPRKPRASTILTISLHLAALAAAGKVIGEEGILAVMKTENLDALVAPTTGPAWKTDYKNGDTPGFVTPAPAAIAGYPHVAVPMGRVADLPVGISIFAGPWQDARVLGLAYAYEQLSDK